MSEVSQYCVLLASTHLLILMAMEYLKFLDHPVDFVSNPNMVATPTAAALSSIWYWLTFVRPRTKNFSNTKQVTQKINTGLKGQANREQKAKDWQTALHVKPIKPGQGIKVASK